MKNGTYGRVNESYGSLTDRETGVIDESNDTAEDGRTCACREFVVSTISRCGKETTGTDSFRR